jgi:phospholipid/cholesterol/gamma-HCH transport system ATP-binding protein
MPNEVSADSVYCSSCGQELTPDRRPPAIELTDICKSFGRTRVFDHLNFRAQAGETVVVVGMSGSGKSVLMEQMIGFQPPDKGSVRLFGVDPRSEHATGASQAMREEIGVVFQGSALIDSLSARRNVMLPLTTRDIPENEAATRADELLEAVGLADTDGGLLPAELSVGMQKRVGIARALISSPKILFYDEPTTGLDAATSRRINRLMRRVQLSNPNLTSVVMTHDYFSAGILADRVLYLDRSQGRLREAVGTGEIASIREHHGQDERGAVDEIRGRLEAFLDQLDSSQALRSGPEEEGFSCPAAVVNALKGAFHLIGSAILLLGRVGWQLDWSAVPGRVYQLGIESLPVICLAGLFVGMMLTLQVGMGLADVGMMEALPSIIGVATIEKIGPLVVGLLLAGRIGASISAEFGGKRVTRQFEALRAMAVSPERYWLTPILVATVLTMPFVTLAFEGSAIAGAYAVSVVRYGVTSSLFLDRVLDDVRPTILVFGLLRSVVFGLAVCLLAYAKGAEEKRSSDDIGRATTVAVTSAFVAVIVLDFIMVFVISGS